MRQLVSKSRKSQFNLVTRIKPYINMTITPTTGAKRSKIFSCNSCTDKVFFLESATVQPIAIRMVRSISDSNKIWLATKGQLPIL